MSADYVEIGDCLDSFGHKISVGYAGDVVVIELSDRMPARIRLEGGEREHFDRLYITAGHAADAHKGGAA
jgi:hypothetical protein